MRSLKLGLPILTLAILALAGCGDSGDGDGPPPPPPPNDAGNDTSRPDVVVDQFTPDVPPGDVTGDEGTPAIVCTPDEDGDNIPDEVEGRAEDRDSDTDGTPDYLDDDSDGDTIPDEIEGNTADVGCLTPLDSDGDTTPDYLDDDSDGNGVDDRDEVYPDGAAYSASHPAPNPADTDGNGRPDYVDKDNDGDNLDDVTELGGEASTDTDGDGFDDIFDPDCDGDSILDGHEGVTDFDDDGDPNFRDLDSDDDGLLDECEAGTGHVLDQLPPDTDQDGKYDFADLDSDNDGIPDAEEDANQNCVLDAGETSPTHGDTDNDGADDLIEVALGSDPRDPTETPESLGKFYFKIPYQQPPVPDRHTLPVKTTLSKADVAFLVDTTGTMAGEMNALKVGLQQVIQTLLQDIPELAVGVAGFDDFPVDPYGEVALSDKPYYLPTPAGILSTTPADSVAAVSQLSIHGGGDIPESQIPAMVRAISNAPIQWPGNYWPPDPVPSGRYGAMAFRNDAFPVVVAITDAPFHNGRRASAPTVLHDPYSFNATSNVDTMDELVQAMNDKGARFIGFASDNGTRVGDPYEDMAYLCDHTNSYVSPAAFGGACTTGIGGAPIGAPDGPGGTCRLVFNVYQNGNGLTARIVDAVQGMLKGLLLDMRVTAISDPPAAPLFVDSVDQFVSHITVSQNGGSDPTEPGVDCIIVNSNSLADRYTGPKGLIASPDTYNESVLGVTPTSKICFNVVPKSNTIVPATDEVQVFHAVLQVKARKTATEEINLGQPRDVLFVVPPLQQ